MKRAGNLWPAVTAWENLLDSAYAAAQGKRLRPDVSRFFSELEGNLCRLQRDLLDGSYRPGSYRTFWIHDPKPRQISAAPFRDRVVHHALTRVLEPIFEARFSAYSFASRKGFGQHRALEVAREACARYRYVLKCDVRKYFPSIDHAILKDLLGRVVKCRSTLDLAFRIIDGSNAQEESIAYFPGDDLFGPFERRRGLPIGNQTSQFFANVYLNPPDQFAMRELRPACYVRYVDDVVVFGDDKDELRELRERVIEFLAALRLRIHEGKSRAYVCADGFPFLGWRLFPDRARLPRPNVVRVRRRFRAVAKRYHAGRLDFAGVRARVHAWIGHASFGNTWRLRRDILRKVKLVGAERGRNCSARGLLEQ